MNTHPSALLLVFATASLLFLHPSSTQGGQEVEPSTPQATPPPQPATRIETGFDYVAPARFTGSTDAGKISIFTLSTSLQHTFQVLPDTGLIVGGTYRQFWFPSEGGSDVIPNNAGSFAATFGVRQNFLEKWTFLALGNVGIYSSEWNSSGEDSWNFDAQATIGYAFSENLSAFVGVAVFPQFQIPVLPAVGLRWQINEQWNLNLVMPKPTVEYEFAEGWKLYVFGQLAGGRFRTASDFGAPMRTNLGNRWMSYLDIRTGGGIAWSPVPAVTLRAETGASVYREFEFDGAGFSVHAGPALMASTSVSVRF